MGEVEGIRPLLIIENGDFVADNYSLEGTAGGIGKSELNGSRRKISTCGLNPQDVIPAVFPQLETVNPPGSCPAERRSPGVVSRGFRSAKIEVSVAQATDGPEIGIQLPGNRIGLKSLSAITVEIFPKNGFGQRPGGRNSPGERPKTSISGSAQFRQKPYSDVFPA